MATPWLSVIIPTYNGARFIKQTLESVVAQHAADVEVIVVDDGSTDDTIKILESFSDRLRLSLIEGERVGNWVAATNRGLQSASGYYASLLHQDDLWMPGRIAAIRKALATGTSERFVVHPVVFIDEYGRPVGRWRCPLPSGVSLPPSRMVEQLLVQNFISVLGPTFPRGLALELGALREELWYTADWDLWIRLSGRAPTVHIPAFLGALRLHGGSITATRSARLDQFRWQLERVLDEHLGPWSAEAKRKRRVTAAARFSVDVNVALAGGVHGRRVPLIRLFRQFLALGPSGWSRYLRDSRILERAGARMRAGLGRRVDRGPPGPHLNRGPS